MQQQWTISPSSCDMWWKVDIIQQLTTASSERRNSKESQTCSKLVPKKSSWSLFGGLLLLWPTAFWISVKPLHLRNMLSRLIRCTKNCNTYGWHHLTEWAQFLSMTMLDHMSYNQHFKNWMNLTMNFCLIFHIHTTSHQPTTTFSSISITFFRESISTTSKMQKEFLESWNMDFYATRRNILISHWQKDVDCNGSYSE